MSLDEVVMAIQPLGGVQEVGCNGMAVGGEELAVPAGVSVCVAVWSVDVGVDVSVGVDVGKMRGRVGGICVGVAGGGRVSASASVMPPITKTTDTRAMMTPPPNWRRDCISNSPRLWQACSSKWAEGR